MIRNILLDCGGVIVAPTLGDWLLMPGHEAILGEDFAEKHLDAFRQKRRAFHYLIPDGHVVSTDVEECAMFPAYFKGVFTAMGMPLSREDLETLSHLQVYRDDRYIVFDDVLTALDDLHRTYRLGILSDAPPSTRRIMDTIGVTERLDAATYSCEIGVLKPNPEIYRRALDKLGAVAEETVFVDDMPGNLLGAQALGIHGIQMRRPMPARFVMPPAWDGPVVSDLVSLGPLLATM